jgi:hypothetical protein
MWDKEEMQEYGERGKHIRDKNAIEREVIRAGCVSEEPSLFCSTCFGMRVHALSFALKRTLKRVLHTGNVFYERFGCKKHRYQCLDVQALPIIPCLCKYMPKQD